MIRIEIEPVWRFRRESDGQTMLVMLDFLNEIRATGKITQAADRANLSYRHCWNLIEKWADFFGAPLVEREQGRGTRLTELGEKLVWAGQRLQARLRPQLQNLAQELETEISAALPQQGDMLRVHASHGFAVSKLRELLQREHHMGVDLRYVSNQNSLVSLAHGTCDLAGVHLPQGELRKKAVAATKPWLSASEHRVIGFVTREMGLMVKRGNPLRVTSLERLVDPSVRFVNRDPDSGTRLAVRSAAGSAAHRREEASTGTNEWSSRTPPLPPTSRATWPMLPLVSKPRPASSISTSCRWSRRTISSSAGNRRWNSNR